MLKLVKIIVGLYLFCLVGKLAISLFDGKLTRYSFRDQSVDNVSLKANWDGKSPKLLALNPTDYKLVNNSIIANTSGSLREIKSPDCIVMDLKNWECTWQENVFHKGKIINNVTLNETMEDGEYYFFSSAWSFNELIIENKYRDVSYLHYHVNGCKWDFYDSKAIGLIVCPLRFIFN